LIPALWERPDVREGLPAERLDNYVAYDELGAK
jgi:hypothetical protein